LTSVSKAVKSPCVGLEQRACEQNFFGETIAHHPEDLLPDIGLQAVDGQDHVALLLQQDLDPLLVGDTQGHQFLIAVHEMGHAAQGDGDPTGQQGLVHFRHTAVLAKAPLANQRNDIQAKLAMRQRPAPFFFRTLAFMVVGAVRLDL
jgi:hypothetical protein